MTRLGWVVIAAVAVLVGGCNPDRVAHVELPGYYQPCGSGGACRPPLVCDTSDSLCKPSGTVPVGGACVFTGDCQSDLFCSNKVCTAAGTTQQDEPCAATADCQSGLYCAFTGFGGTCSSGGKGDINSACSTTGDCAPGLLCNPFSRSCSTDKPAPIGKSCQDDTDCATDKGIYCDATTNTCQGRGIDGMPVTPWDGATCSDTNSQQGAFRVLFKVPAAGSAGDDFFSLPYPNDIRRKADGTLDLTGFPKPPAGAVPSDVLGSYIKAIEASQTGYGPHQAVYFRFSGTPLFCASGCGTSGQPACQAGCMGGANEPTPTVLLYDITPGVAPHRPTHWTWAASSGRTPYLCWNWLALRPVGQSHWAAGHTYVVFIRSIVMSGDPNHQGDPIQQDSDFAAMLQDTVPTDSRLQGAWTAYQPLRDWLATSPTFASGNVIKESDIAGAAVFTVQDPTTTLQALADAIEAGPAATVKVVAVCDGSASAPATCTDTSSMGFTEVDGTVGLPNFQQGTLPYLDAGGGIGLDSSGAAVQSSTTQTLPVKFALSVPTGTPPSGGWPVIIYAHGTGGSYRSHITNGVAQALASVNVSVTSSIAQFAVLGIDQVAHGSRKGGSTLDSERLFFNFTNPGAARGNVLQAAADQLSLLHAISAFSDALSSSSLGGTLDASQVAFLGHSQGATAGAVAMARAVGIDAVVLSGAGGGLIDSLMNKTSPYNLPAITRLVLADPSLTAAGANFQPALSIIQSYLAPADPINFGAHLAMTPLGSGTPKNVLEIIGAGDTYTPNVTALNLGDAIGVDFIDDDSTGILRPSDPTAATGDVSGNGIGGLTLVGSIHAAPPNQDGHFVMFVAGGKAQVRMQQFFGTWLTDSANPPTVVR